APVDILELAAPGEPRQRGIVEEDVICEIAPGQFGEEFLNVARWRRALLLGVSRGAPDLGGADLAEVQMRGEARGDVLGGKIALCGVAVDVGFEEIAQPLAGAGLAGRPGGGEAGGPVGPGGMERPAGEIVGLEIAEAAELARFGRWIGKADRLAQCAPEG